MKLIVATIGAGNAEDAEDDVPEVRWRAERPGHWGAEDAGDDVLVLGADDDEDDPQPKPETTRHPHWSRYILIIVSSVVLYNTNTPQPRPERACQP
jgi:hypothetical protein